MQTQIHCSCIKEADFRMILPDEYIRVRRLFSKWRHPTFIGNEMIKRAAMKGGVYEMIYRGETIALIIYKTEQSVLYALCIRPDHRSHGLGNRIMLYFKFWFVRAIESSVLYFEKLGYQKISTPKQGRKYITWIMVHKDLLSLCGRFSKLRKSNIL